MEIEWRPSIGDPTAIGWITVAMYLIASAACFTAANRSQLAGRNWWKDGALWLLLTLLFLGLGINKQLDLQSLFTELARDAAKGGGWYEQRRAYQQVFIVGTACVSAVTAVLLLLWSWRLGRVQRIAIFGACFIVTFVLVRAASFHHVDQLLSDRVLGARWNWIIELTGIAIVGFSAIYYAHTHRLRHFGIHVRIRKSQGSGRSAVRRS